MVAAAAAAEMLVDGRCQMRLKLAAAAAAVMLGEAPCPAAQTQLARLQAAVSLSCCKQTKQEPIRNSTSDCRKTKCGTVDESSETLAVS